MLTRLLLVIGILVAAAPSAVTQQAAQSNRFDLLFRNARVYDGNGNPWIRADVGIVTVAPDASVAQLMDIFRRGMVAIVVDGDEFLGLITRIDLLNWLRRRTQP